MNNTELSYGSLEEIRQRKMKLKSEIVGKEKKIGRMWNNLFHSQEDNGIPTPSKRITSIISTGVSILDGAILGLKLYRKFKKK